MPENVLLEDAYLNERVHYFTEAEIVNNEAENKTEKFKAARTKKFWTDEETELLRKGMELHGHSWAAIKEQFPQLDRTPVQMKDRARSVKKILLEKGLNPGIWG